MLKHRIAAIALILGSASACNLYFDDPSSSRHGDPAPDGGWWDQDAGTDGPSYYPDAYVPDDGGGCCNHYPDAAVSDAGCGSGGTHDGGGFYPDAGIGTHDGGGYHPDAYH